MRDEMVEQIAQLLPIARDIDQKDRLVVQPKLAPGEDFEGLVERADAARQDRESIRPFGHQPLAVVHAAGDDEFAGAWMRQLGIAQPVRDDADDPAARHQSRIGKHPHQPDPPAAKDQLDACLRQGFAQLPRGGAVTQIEPDGRAAIDAKSRYVLHRTPPITRHTGSSSSPVFVRSGGDCKHAWPGIELPGHQPRRLASVRRVVWLGSATAAVLIVLAAAFGLRDTAPPSTPAPQPAVPTAPLPAAAATTPATAQVVPATLPSFDIVRVDPQGQAVIAGRAAPGDRVRVLDAGKPIGEVTADSRGEWVLVPDAPLMQGNRQLALEATSREGGPVRRSGDVVALSVTPPAPAERSPSTLAVLIPGDADKPSRVLQQPAPPSVSPKLSLETAEYGARSRLMLSGHAAPGAHLNVYAGDRPLGTVTADAAGKWSLTAPHREAAGGVELRLDELAADGTVARRIATPLQAVGASALAAGGSYIVRRGNSLWLIARHIYGKGTRYTAIYSANRDQIRDPNRIYPGQLFKLPKS